MTTKFNEVNVRNGPGLNHLKIYKNFCFKVYGKNIKSKRNEMLHRDEISQHKSFSIAYLRLGALV